MQTKKISDRQVLYNMIERTIHNYTKNTPLLAVFEGTIVNYIINFVDPYLDVFSDETNHIDIDQLADYTSYEIQERIKKFKENYTKEVPNEN